MPILHPFLWRMWLKSKINRLNASLSALVAARSESKAAGKFYVRINETSQQQMHAKVPRADHRGCKGEQRNSKLAEKKNNLKIQNNLRNFSQIWLRSRRLDIDQIIIFHTFRAVDVDVGFTISQLIIVVVVWNMMSKKMSILSSANLWKKKMKFQRYSSDVYLSNDCRINMFSAMDDNGDGCWYTFSHVLGTSSAPLSSHHTRYRSFKRVV